MICYYYLEPFAGEIFRSNYIILEANICCYFVFVSQCGEWFLFCKQMSCTRSCRKCSPCANVYLTFAFKFDLLLSLFLNVHHWLKRKPKILPYVNINGISSRFLWNTCCHHETSVVSFTLWACFQRLRFKSQRMLMVQLDYSLFECFGEM